MEFTVFRQMNAPCALTDTLVNTGGPGEYFGGFAAISGHFWLIFVYFKGNIPPESARGAFIQAGAFIWQNTVVCLRPDLAHQSLNEAVVHITRSLIFWSNCLLAGCGGGGAD